MRSLKERLRAGGSAVLLRYTLIGFSATVLNYLIYRFCSARFDIRALGGLRQSGTLWAANTIAWFFSTLYAYFGNRLFVYHAAEKGVRMARQVFSFFLWRFASVIAETALLNLLVTAAGMPDQYAKLIAITASTAANYFTGKYFTFRHKK